jgi:hypothetical protein
MTNTQYIKFNNKLTVVDTIKLPITEDVIKRTPQLYRYSADKAINDFEDVIIHSFIKKCNMDIGTSFGYKYTSLDTRVHMLKPGMYPCIGGWHCDDFYRDETTGQPLLNNIDEVCPQVHYMCTIGDTALPQFFISDLTAKIDRNNVYKSLQKRLPEKDLETWDIYQPKSGEIVKIGPSAIHRGIAADKSAWRLFMRLTYSKHRFAKNEIRTQTQVYLTNMDGW